MECWKSEANREDRLTSNVLPPPGNSPCLSINGNNCHFADPRNLRIKLANSGLMFSISSADQLLTSIRDKTDNEISKSDESFKGKHVGENRFEAGAMSTILRVQAHRPLVQ